MGHQTVAQGFVDHLPDLFRLGAEQVGSCYHDLLTHTDQNIGVGPQQRVDQIKMLHNHPLAVLQRLNDGIRQFTQLGKTGLKADIQMVGMGGEKGETPVLLQQGQGTDIHAVIVVGQFQPWEHTPDQGALAGSGIANDADQFV